MFEITEYNQIAKTVTRHGFALLSDFFGNESWMNKIDVENLDNSGDKESVLGQLFGSYQSGINILSAHRVMTIYPEMYGFIIREEFVNNDNYRLLNDLWKYQIRSKTGLDFRVRWIAEYYGFSIKYEDNVWKVSEVSKTGRSGFFWESTSSVENFLEKLKVYHQSLGQESYVEYMFNGNVFGINHPEKK